MLACARRADRARGRRQRRRRADDPLHGRLRRLSRARDALRAAGGAAPAAREPVVGGRRSAPRARRRCCADERDGRVLRPQHAGRALGRDPVRRSLAAVREGARGSSTRTASSSSSEAASRGRRRTSCRRPLAGAARVRTTCWTSGRSQNACASARSPSSSRPRRPRRVVPLEDLPFAAAGGGRRGRPRDRLDHAHDRRPPGRRPCARAG